MADSLFTRPCYQTHGYGPSSAGKWGMLKWPDSPEKVSVFTAMKRMVKFLSNELWVISSVTSSLQCNRIDGMCWSLSDPLVHLLKLIHGLGNLRITWILQLTFNYINNLDTIYLEKSAVRFTLCNYCISLPIVRTFHPTSFSLIVPTTNMHRNKRLLACSADHSFVCCLCVPQHMTYLGQNTPPEPQQSLRLSISESGTRIRELSG